MNRPMRAWLAAAIVVVVALMPACRTLHRPPQTEPEEQELPSARELIDKFVTAVGGEKAMRKHKSVSMTGSFSMPAASLEGKLRIDAMAPNLNLVSLEIPGIGNVREGYDGKVAWSVEPMSGPRVKQGKELAQTAFQSDFLAALHEDDRYESMETIGTMQVGDAECYKVRLVTINGDEIFEYYDMDSGLMLQTEMTVSSQMGEIAMTQTSEDYREFEGIKLPTKMTVTIGPMQQVLTISEVTVNTLEKSAFEPPAEILALVAE